MAQRWQKAGCWSLLLAPFFAAGCGLLVAAGIRLSEGLDLASVSISLVTLVCGLLVAGTAGFVVYRAALRREGGPPPQPSSVAPRPRRSAPVAPAAAAGLVSPGRVGRTRIHVVEWQPGRVLRLLQARSWGLAGAFCSVMLLFGMFVVAPSLENQVLAGGEIRVGLPQQMILVIGSWALIGFAWLSLPTLARSVTLDWERDSVEIGYGRRRRELGLSRVRGIELYEQIGATVNPETQHATDTTHTVRLVAWVEPDAHDPVPYLLVESKPASRRGGEKILSALTPLAERLAAAIGVPCARPERAVQDEPHE